MHNQVYLCHWGAIVDRDQNTFFTNGPLILLPTKYRKPLMDGQNLEDIMHHSTGIKNLGSKKGAIGVFTQGCLNREQVLTHIVKALVGHITTISLLIKKQPYSNSISFPISYKTSGKNLLDLANRWNN